MPKYMKIIHFCPEIKNLHITLIKIATVKRIKMLRNQIIV